MEAKLLAASNKEKSIFYFFKWMSIVFTVDVKQPRETCPGCCWIFWVFTLCADTLPWVDSTARL